MRRLIKIFLVYKIFWTVCGLIFIANLIVYFGPVSDQKNRIEQLQKQYSKLRSQNLLVDEKDEPTENYYKAEQSLQTFKAALPTMDLVSEKARELCELIDAQGSYPGAVLFKPKWIKELGLWQYSTSFTIKNRYEKVKQILAAIQNSSSLFCIEHLSIQKGKEEDQVELKLVAATYCR